MNFPKFIEEKNKITVSETFYSIQGEGRFIGVPSIFLRTQGCLLNCIWCDTYNVWKNGLSYTNEQLLNLWKQLGFIDLINSKAIHIIFTGGEPLARQTPLLNFFKYIINKGEITYSSLNDNIEVETACTVKPTQEFEDFFKPYYNVSPKLENSGMDLQRRVRSDVLNYFVNNNKSIFKFVIASEKDIEEVIQTYVKPYNINNKLVYLMAESATKKQLNDNELNVVKLAMKYKFRYSTRLHLHIWDKATGV